MANIVTLDAVGLIRRLIDISSKLNDARPLHQRMTDLCAVTADLLSCDRVSIMVWDGEFFRAQFNWGNPPDIAAVFRTYRTSMNAPVVSQAFAGPDDFVVVNDAKHHPALRRIAEIFRIESIVVAAMYDRDRQPLGFMTAEYNERLGRFERTHAEVALGAAQLAQSALLVEREWQSRVRLAGELRSAVDDERRRLGRDIHDDPLQRVFAIRVRLEGLRAQSTDPATSETLDALIADCAAAGAALRDLAVDTHPATADGRSVVRSLERLIVRHSTNGGWTHEFRSESVPELDSATAVLLLRIADQALLNVVLHANASRVTVELGESDGGLQLTIADDGVGFDEHTTRRGHLGLVSMREHADDIGGRVSVSSEVGAGTSVVLWLPR